jgi:phosphopantothenoylcysteine decarboxylase/phosphopantothenate--cysteine ligase
VNIAFGIAGGISAYKSTEAVRALRMSGHHVQVVLTRAATEFVAPLTLAVLSGHPVLEHMFETPASPIVRHVELAAWADALVVAPATADVLARFARGLADDLLAATYLGFEGPVLLAPAMESAMWNSPAVRENVEILRARGVRFVGPGDGPLASGRSGIGRMAEPEEIVRAAGRLEQSPDGLSGARVLVTAGPTREAIDPIRFVSNRSSGRMGFALAEEAAARGARVVLLAGPTELKPPAGVEVRRFETARELANLLGDEFPSAEILMMAAAVSDFIPERVGRRLHRADGPRSFVLTPGLDLLAGLAAGKEDRLIVAFAAESESDEAAARRKMEAKGADWIVLNDVSRPEIGFESLENEVVLLSRAGERIEVSRRPKADVARKIWDAVSSNPSWRKAPASL